MHYRILSGSLISGTIPTELLQESLSQLDLTGTCLSPLINYAAVFANDYNNFVPNPLCPTPATLPTYPASVPYTPTHQYEFSASNPYADSVATGAVSLNVNDFSASVVDINIQQGPLALNGALSIGAEASKFALRSGRVTLGTTFSVEILFAVPSFASGVQDILCLARTSDLSTIVWRLSYT